MPQPKQIRLAINLLATGRHNASWKTLPDPETLSTDIDVFVQIAKTAERGLFDGIFLADNYAGLAGESFKRPFRALSPIRVPSPLPPLQTDLRPEPWNRTTGAASWPTLTPEPEAPPAS